ncbi:MAG: DUF971 domain-containing protein [Ignavibacteriales bacterium]|nr:DUF971 domain-containing protein [Ignavibacteriales bacterium]
MIATQIKLEADEVLAIRWDDGHQSVVPLHTLRDQCPCAGCQGETVLLRSYQPLPQPALPGKYTLKSAQPIGHYALQLAWGDGHTTGIYTWETLRNLCQCEQCSNGK